MRRFGSYTVMLLLAAIAAACSIAPAQKPAPGMHEVWIEMPDGVRLAADIYLPAAGAAKRYPVLLEYLPYRKTESRARNHALYSYFLKHNYAVARVDIRGTGNSEGRTIPYEYSDIELDDGEAVIDWLARQPWSSGKVGMFGISWGGFNAIQMAMRNPPALGAFVSVMATEALYQEDVHYMDGIIHTDSWMMSHDLYNAMPGAPGFVLDQAWESNRFEVEPSVFTYMRHQRDGAFWDRASARGRYDQIRIPGFHIGGWYDGYRNSVPRMLEHVAAPVKAIIGPWDHYFPHNAWPKPQIEWRAEAVRWFDHWLRGMDTGIVAEPKLAVYVRDYATPNPAAESIPGRWRWESGWPIKRADSQVWFATAGHSLGPAAGPSHIHQMAYLPSMGLEGGGPTMWWGSITPDQQPMDDKSLVYDSAPLDAPLEILGRPQVKLVVSASAPRANWVVRLSDVAPDGQVTQVSGAGFNGTHRLSARSPQDLVAGEEFELEVNMHLTSWTFRKGHRLRLAVSNAQWPMFWPTPYPMTSTLRAGGPEGTQLSLPVVSTTQWNEPAFQQPEPDPSLSGYTTLDAGNVTGYAAITTIDRDAATDQAVGVASNSGATQYPWGVERFEESIEHRTSDKDPAHTSVLGRYALVQELEARTLRFEQEVQFSSDPDHFRLTIHRRVFQNDKLFREKTWDEQIPRDYQ